MKSLELFAGSRSFSKVAESRGFECLSIDKFIESGNILMDIVEVTPELILQNLGVPNIIWGSPVCSAWSKTGWFHYWDTQQYKKNRKFVAKKPFALESVKMIEATIDLIAAFPGVKFAIENPEGMLYRHPVMNKLSKLGYVTRKKVTYCQYGFDIMKPTHIWTNIDFPAKYCTNGDDCHMSSPRCSQKGIMSKKGKYERSKVPANLCHSILDYSFPMALNS